MSTPTPRPTRSRISSPFVPAPSNAVADPKNTMAEISEKPKTFLDKWVEPPLPPPRPSFMDAGIERHGVVQNMAPLGTRPSQKVIKNATKPDGELFGRGGHSKRSGPSAVSTPSESVMTPEPPTNPPHRRSISINKVEEVESAPQTPQQPTSARKSVSRPSIGPQNNGQGVFQLQQSPIPLATNMTRPTPATPQAAPPPAAATPGPTLGQDGLPLINLDKTDRVVEEAVQEALDHRRWPTAYALRTLYDDHRTNPRIVRLIEAIYNGRASEANHVEFKSIMRQKKMEGKKDRTGEYYFNGDGSDPAPAVRPVISNIIAINPPPTTPYQTPYTPLPPKSASLMGRASSVNIPPSSSASAHKDREQDGHISKKHRSNSFQPVNARAEMNGVASANGAQAGSPVHANGAPKSVKGTPGKSRRSRSMSTSSSLSSIDERKFEGADFSSTGDHGSAGVAGLAKHGLAGLGVGVGVGGGPAPTHFSPYTSANNFIAAASSAETLARNQAQPITAPPKPGPKLGHFTVITSTSPAVALSPSAKSPTSSAANNAPPQTSSTSTSSTSMAPAALLASSSNSSSVSLHHFPSSFKAKNLAKIKGGDPYDPNDKTSRLRRRARETTNSLAADISDSFERHRVQSAAAQDTESASDGGDSVAPAKVTRRPPKVRLLNKNKSRETRQRYNYDSEDLSSPTLLSFQPDLAPGGSLSVSRAGTPNNFNRPTRKARTGTGLRVKTSPMKKKGGGTLAGIPRASGERNSPVGNGALPHNQDDNDDYCSACGGNGDLVCCDGCTRSFHFKCVDPPMVEGNLPDEWFCNHCQSQRRPHGHDLLPGTFGQLLLLLDEKNPSAFHLPKAIREYFVDVQTSAEGEYVEAGTTKPKNHRGGWDEAPDYFRLKDAKGKTILCHECHGAASPPDRMIVPCSFCGLSWHLDCLPVPLAKEPAPGRQWRCPAHVDDLLAQVPATLAPAHRFRRIKGASAIKPAISRGIKNNGYIEIESEPSEDEEEQGFYEQREYGHVYKLPEQGIKLDFISKVRREGGGYLPSRFASRRPKPPPRPTWNQRSVNEQQAALNLAALAAQNSDLDHLVKFLQTEASPDVIGLMAVDQADKLAKRLPIEGNEQFIATMKALFDKLYAQVHPELAPAELAPAEPGLAEPVVAEHENATPENPIIENSENAENTIGEPVEAVATPAEPAEPAAMDVENQADGQDERQCERKSEDRAKIEDKDEDTEMQL